MDDPLIPNLSSFFPNSNPLIGFGNTKADIPLCFKLLSVVAKTIVALLSYPFVIQHFVPFKIHLSPASLAMVEAAPASEPLPGSDKAKQPIGSPEKVNFKIKFQYIFFYKLLKYYKLIVDRKIELLNST